MNSLSPLNRVLRSLTALIAVWCLGCNAFDPLIASLFPGAGRGMMVCAAEAPATGVALQDRGGRPASVRAFADHADRGTSCDCGSCCAPAPSPLASALAPSPVAQQPAPEPCALPSVARAPLVPPPQFGA